MKQPVEEWLGVTAESKSTGETVLRMTVTEAHINGAGYVHGGVLFALADCALAHAAIIPGDGATVTAHISFIAPGRAGDELVATARAAASWGSNTLVDVMIRHGHDVIAAFQGQARGPGARVISSGKG